MEDLFESTFAGLDEFYPGSKRKRKTVLEPETKEAVDTSWDARPYKKVMPNGKELEMFTLGALAAALNRPVITLRVWMKQGHLPASPYRLPSQVDKNGEVRQGRRLYSRAMIEAAVEVFRSAGLLNTNRVDWTVHQNLGDKISEAWNEIRANELKTENTENPAI